MENEEPKKITRGMSEGSKRTQFGGENANPAPYQNGGNKPWSIRNSLRHLARQPIDMSDPKAFQSLLPEKPTVAQVIAANSLAKASRGDMRAVEYATDNIDGKMPQVNINAEFAELLGMSDEELLAIAEGAERTSEGSSSQDHSEPASDDAPEVAPETGADTSA